MDCFKSIRTVMRAEGTPYERPTLREAMANVTANSLLAKKFQKRSQEIVFAELYKIADSMQVCSVCLFTRLVFSS